MDQRRRWSFVQSDDYGWMWTVVNPDGTQQTSQSFGTIKECADDARQNGYVPWKPEDERRRELKLRVAEALRRRAPETPAAPAGANKADTDDKDGAA